MTDGVWSPTRPGVFYTTKTDGTLDVYDLMVRHSVPTLRVQVADCLRCVSGESRRSNLRKELSSKKTQTQKTTSRTQFLTVFYSSPRRCANRHRRPEWGYDPVGTE